MSKYSNGKIYTIRCKTDDSLIYVGSTIQPLTHRWGNHKAVAKRHPDIHFYSMINTNWENWYIELYENYPCETNEQLHKREGEITRLIGTLNRRIEGRTTKEYYQENKQMCLENKKEYRKKNIEKISDYQKEYRKKNRETNIKYQQKRRENLKISSSNIQDSQNE